MSRLKELSQDKLNIMKKLISSKNLCKALNYSQSNFLDQPDIADPSELIYKNIFPYKLINQIQEQTSTFICLSFNNYRSVGTTFKSGLIYLHVFCHYSLFQTDYGTLRYDYIASEVDELFNQQRSLGIGKTQFYSLDELYVNDKYQGLTIGYQVLDFN